MTTAAPPRPLDSLSTAERLILSCEWDAWVASLPPHLRDRLDFQWSLWRRPNQSRPTGDWRTWLILAGRGYGKTRTGAESIRDAVYSTDPSTRARRVGLIAATAADGRDVMVEGESGLLAVHPPAMRPTYEPSKRRLTWPNGAIATVYSADKPDRLRGPQHDLIWGDEPASWRFGEQAFDNAIFGLRLGRRPVMILTGTPKPTRWLRVLAERDDCVVTKGSTYQNIANLPPTFVADVLGRYEGTRLGRQELHAEFLDDVEGALWTELVIDSGRIAEFDRRRPWTSINAWLVALGEPMLADRRAWRTVVAVDPPGETAECGIVAGSAPVQGKAGRDHAVVIEDASMTGRPEEWGAAVVACARRVGAERVVVESNQGGDMVRSTVHAVDPTVRVEKIRADESKQARAEPVSALYERRFVHHHGHFPMLESQMVTWVPGESRSPDRLDAAVHLIRELLRDVAHRPTKVHNPASRRR